MGNTYNSFDTLLSAIRGKMVDAMNSAERRSLEKAKYNARDFYSQGDPEYYVNTFKYADAPDSTGVMGEGNHLEAEIYMNPAGHGYTTGTFSAQEVWEAAETGSAGVLGKTGRWAQTEQDIDNIVKEEFRKRFN